MLEIAWKIVCCLLMIVFIICPDAEPCLRRNSEPDTDSRPNIQTETLIFSDGSCQATEAGADAFSKVLLSHQNQLTFDLFNVTINCTYTMQAVDPYTRVMVDFRWFDVSRRTGHGNLNCEHASVTFFDGPETSTAAINRVLCGTKRPDLVLSLGSSLTMKLHASGEFSVMDFRAIYTQFSDGTPCDSFTCSTTRRCVDVAVTCDNQGVGNCGNEDISDQEEADCPVIYTTTDLRPLLFLAIAVLIPVVIFQLYWLFLRPGYMVWACGCWRHWSFCCWEYGRGCSNCCCDCCPTGGRRCCRRMLTCGRDTKKNSVVGVSDTRH